MLSAFVLAGSLIQTVPNWVPPAVDDLRRSGDLVGFAVGCRGGSEYTRYEMAVAAWATYQHMLVRSAKDSRPTSASIGIVKRMAGEFHRELTSMGVDQKLYAVMISDLDRWHVTNQTLFRDVPANHWAAGAIRTLKAEGLLKGYPHGTFRGGR